jgi:hypothetical protein
LILGLISLDFAKLMYHIIINSSNLSKDRSDKDSVYDSDNSSFLKCFYLKIY